jgi:protein-disulfide isomerase
MTASLLRRGARAGSAALAAAAVLALPAFAQNATGGGAPERAQSAPAESAPAESAPAQSTPVPGGQAADSGAPAAAEQPAGATAGAAAQDETEAQAPYVLGDIALGEPDAPLTIYEYASFTCPHCAAFHKETFPEFKEKYIDTGKVRFVLREVYFDQYGLWASMVARCGGEDGFYPLVETFLSTQSSWTRAPDIGHAIQQVGRRAGLPAERLQQCLSDRDFAKQLLEDYQENREADEIQSTPTFVIEGEKHTGAMAFEEFSALVDGAL